MKVYVLDDFQGTVEKLGARKLLEGLNVELTVLTEHIEDEAALVDRIKDADVLVPIRERTQITQRVIDALPRLQMIAQTGRLTGNIDLAACEARHIKVTEGSGNPIAPAELTWALLLAASRRLVPYIEHLKRGEWQRSSDQLQDEALGQVVHGRTLGVWALGRIGSRVAQYAQAFGMNVVAHGREHTREAAEQAGIPYIADRKEFLSRVDVLTLHLKLNRGTRHILTAADLNYMQPGAMLINTSRAELIERGALLKALDQGRPGFAALDVFEDEPEGVTRYLNHPRILCSPHIGFVEKTTYESYFGTAFAQVREFIQGHQGA